MATNADSNNMNYTCDQLFPPEDMTNASVYMASPLNYMDTKLSFEATDSHVFSNDLEVDSVPCDSVSLKPYRPVVFDRDFKIPLIKEEMKDFKSPLIKEEMKDWKSPLIKEEMKDFKSPLVKKEEWKDSVGIKLCKTEKEKMSTKNVKSEFKKGVESCKEMKKLPAEVKTERPDPDLKKEPASEKKIPLHLDLLMSFRTFCASGSIKDLLMKNRSLMLIPDKYGDNCLHLALINNQSDVVQNLLPVIAIAPEDLNISNHRFQTGLHLAVLTNQPDMVELLLKQGIKRTLVDCNGNTAVHLAVKYDHIKCLKSLLKPDTQKHSLSDPFPDVDMLNCDGYSPLHLACLKGSIESVQLLIESKAEVNLPDGKSGRSPLHIAVEKNDLLLAGELLLEAECETECVTYDGNTPLHLACGREYDTMVALLLSVGADPEATSGMTDWCISDDSDLDSSTDEDQWIDDIKGTRPRDLVFNNEKILRLLNGEPYESISPDSDSDVQDFLGGDLCQLSDQMRLNLANLIDLAEGIENWKSLAKLLNVEYLIDEVKSAGCPTLCILDMYEMLGGQLKDLYSAFLKLEMGDAACLLNQLMR